MAAPGASVLWVGDLMWRALDWAEVARDGAGVMRAPCNIAFNDDIPADLARGAALEADVVT